MNCKEKSDNIRGTPFPLYPKGIDAGMNFYLATPSENGQLKSGGFKQKKYDLEKIQANPFWLAKFPCSGVPVHNMLLIQQYRIKNIENEYLISKKCQISCNSIIEKDSVQDWHYQERPSKSTMQYICKLEQNSVVAFM